MSNNNGWVNNVGQLKETKSGKLQITLDKDITLKKGDRINLEKYSALLDKLAEIGKITAEEAERRKDSQSFVKYVLHKAPSSDQ